MRTYFTFFILMLASLAHAQTDSTEKEKSFLEGAVQFISNQSYAGRTDSFNLPVLVPALSFHTPGGFFAEAKGYYNLSSNNIGFDGISIQPGFEFSPEHWNGEISLIKYFIRDSSNLIITPIKTSLEFYLSNENKIINPYAGAEYLFTNEGNDFMIYGGLSKKIQFTKTGQSPEFSMEPSVSLTGGTQSFYYSFIKHHAVKGNRRKPVIASQNTKTESRQFSPLAASLELPFDLSIGKLETNITPALESPIDLINSGSAGSQNTGSFVYVTMKVGYRF